MFPRESYYFAVARVGKPCKLSKQRKRRLGFVSVEGYCREDNRFTVDPAAFVGKDKFAGERAPHSALCVEE